jgi:hypothetical protein
VPLKTRARVSCVSCELPQVASPKTSGKRVRCGRRSSLDRPVPRWRHIRGLPANCGQMDQPAFDRGLAFDGNMATWAVGPMFCQRIAWLGVGRAAVNSVVKLLADWRPVFCRSKLAGRGPSNWRPNFQWFASGPQPPCTWTPLVAWLFFLRQAIQ